MRGKQIIHIQRKIIPKIWRFQGLKLTTPGWFYNSSIYLPTYYDMALLHHIDNYLQSIFITVYYKPALLLLINIYELHILQGVLLIGKQWSWTMLPPLGTINTVSPKRPHCMVQLIKLSCIRAHACRCSQSMPARPCFKKSTTRLLWGLRPPRHNYIH